MTRRRQFLRTGLVAAAWVAGCTSGESTPDDGPADTSSPEPTVGPTSTPTESPTEPPTETDDGPTETTDGLPTWEPAWAVELPDRRVLGLDPAGGTLYATLKDDGSAAVAAVDPGAREVVWRTGFEGDAVSNSDVAADHDAHDGWSVTVTDDAVYAVAGQRYEHTTLYALNRATGEVRWSLREERDLAVRGVVDGLLVAAGLEFFEPETTHDAPEEPLTTVLYGVDAASGEVRWTREFRGVEDVDVGPTGAYVASERGLTAVGLDGSERWQFDDAGPARRVGAAPDGVFLLTGEDEADTVVHVFDADGRRTWGRSLPVETFLVDGDRLYAAGEVVVAVEARGALAWRQDDFGDWLLLDPDRDTLYARSGIRMDRAAAYDTAGRKRWEFDPPSNNGWAEAATEEWLVATAIGVGGPDDPFYTFYAVDGDGEATRAVSRDSVYDVQGLDGTFYFGDDQSRIQAFEP